MLSYKNILVAVDGSPNANLAFNKAIEIAKRDNAKLTVMTVVDTKLQATLEAYNNENQKKLEDEKRELLEEYKVLIEKENIDSVELLIVFGSPKILISKEVPEKIQADLIICGATGLNAIERFLIGSVSEYVIKNTKCDVLIVKK